MEVMVRAEAEVLDGGDAPTVDFLGDGPGADETRSAEAAAATLADLTLRRARHRARSGDSASGADDSTGSDQRVLTLFLSSGKSLRWWHKEGLLSREIALYLRFLSDGIFDRIQIFSYDAGDRAFVEALADEDPNFRRIEILAPAKRAFTGAMALLWAIIGPFRHRRRIARSGALKTNQINGSWAALLASILSRRPLILRMGYLLSRRLSKNGQSLRAGVARMLERVAYRSARFILVTSQEVAEGLRADRSTAAKTVLTPTYVDVTAFTPKRDYRFDEPVIWVGRFSEQKNLRNLILGCALAGRDLVLVGRGELEPELRELAAQVPIRVEFAGMIPNEALAAKLRQHSVFVLPSLHEGLPKVLIEAMASGLVCIGSNIPGITDLIVDGETGYLVEGFEPAAIASAIDRAHSESDAAIGRRARAAVATTFSLDRYAAREAALYARVSAEGRRRRARGFAGAIRGLRPAHDA